MSALQFDVDLEWRADQRFGEITVGEAHTCVSEPRVMGGTGAGMSPEDLFVAATASSYCVTLAEMLRAVGLPQSSLSIHAEGLVASDAAAERFTTVIVRPTIQGADVARRASLCKGGDRGTQQLLHRQIDPRKHRLCRWRGLSSRSLTSRSARYGTAIRRSDRRKAVRGGTSFDARRWSSARPRHRTIEDRLRRSGLSLPARAAARRATEPSNSLAGLPIACARMSRAFMS